MASVINNLCASILKVNKTFFFSVPYFSPGLVSIMVMINISSSFPSPSYTPDFFPSNSFSSNPPLSRVQFSSVQSLSRV